METIKRKYEEGIPSKEINPISLRIEKNLWIEFKSKVNHLTSLNSKICELIENYIKEQEK